jgi:hypothetical protein
VQPADLDELIARARSYEMTPSEREQQRRSFAYGNTKLENERITREIVDAAAVRLAEGDAEGMA